MTGFKKSLSIFLVLLLLLTSFPMSEKSISFADKKSFSDIDKHYAKQTILNWVDRGLIKGYDDGTFKPNKSITRAEFVHIISDYLDLTEKSEVSFKDVQKNAWYFEDLSKVVNKKLINGYEDNTFRPNNNITRQEACVILSKISNNLPKVKDVHFSDENSFPTWAKQSIINLAQAGIISGYNDATFKAKNDITRAEIVIMLDKIESQKQELKQEKEDKQDKNNKQEKKEDKTQDKEQNRPSSGGGGGGGGSSNQSKDNKDNNSGHSQDFNSKDDPFQVVDLNYKNNKLTATVSNVEPCDLVVEIYEDSENSENKITDSIVKIENQSQNKEINVTFNQQLPQYFVMKAYLKDKDGKKLTDVYTSHNNTKKMIEFLKSTIYDYQAEKVVKLSKYDANNFVVANDKTVKLDESHERIDENTFKFMVNSTTATSLRIGDQVLITTTKQQLSVDENGVEKQQVVGDLVANKIENISKDEHGNTIITLSKAEIDYKDYFDVIKVDTSYAGEYEPKRKSRFYRIFPPIDVGTNGYYTVPIIRNLKSESSYDDKISFKMDIKNTNLGVKFKFYYEFGDELTLEFKTKIDSEYSIEISGTGTKEISIPEKPIQTMIPTPIPGLTVDTDLKFLIEASVNGNLEMDFKREVIVGLKKEKGQQIRRIRDVKTKLGSNSANISGEIKVGLEVKVYASLIKLIKLGVKGKVGLKLKALLEVNNIFENSLFDDFYKACKVAVKGEVSLYSEGKLFAEAFEKFKYELGLENEAKVGTFYASIVNEKESIYGGKPSFGANLSLFNYKTDTLPNGTGENKNYKYRVKIDVKDKNGKIIDTMNDNVNLPITITSEKDNIEHKVENNNIFLYDGKYKVKVKIGDKEISVLKINIDMKYESEDEVENYKAKTYIIKEQGDGKEEKPKPDIDATSDFEFDRHTGTIIRYIGAKKDVVIPSSIDGVAVTTIGERSFYNNWLTSVVIPDTVAVIEKEAFLANELTSVRIPNSVTSIGIAAFSNSGLKSVKIPNSVTNIGADAFSHNELTSVEIPNSVTTIEDSTFYYNKLKSVEIPNSVTAIEPGAFWLNELTSVEIPNSVTFIGDAAFSTNKLKTLVIPSSVTTIGAGAFGTNELTSVEIPNSVSDIDGYTFSKNKLTYVKIPNSVSHIGFQAFKGNKLTSVEIPNSVSHIDIGAFSDNELLSVEIPNSVSRIDREAFMNNKLKSVVIPDSLNIIADRVFSNNELTQIEIPNSIGWIGNYAFKGNKLKSLIIPNSVTVLDSYAFSDNELTSIQIPDSLTYINNHVFENNKLTSVTIPNSVNSIRDWAFKNNKLTSVEIGQDTVVEDEAFDSGVIIKRR